MILKWERISQILALTTIFIAVMGLMGYVPGLELLGSLKESYIPMAPSTALFFIVLSCILLLIQIERLHHLLLNIFQIFSWGVIVFGILEVVGFYVGADLNFEDSLVPITGNLNGTPIARMSPATGGVFSLSGLALVFTVLYKKNNKRREFYGYIKDGLGILTLLAGFTFCLAYLYGTPLLYGNKSVIPMAVTTSLGFILLAFSLLASQKKTYPLSPVTIKTTRGYLFSFIFPLSILSFISGGIAVLISIHLLKINPAIISSILTIFIAGITGIIATLISRHLSRVIDKQKKVVIKSQSALKKSEKKYRNLFETMAQGVVYQNAEGEIISANTAAENILGLTTDQMMGRKSVDPEWKAVDENLNELQGEKHPAMLALKTGKEIKNFVQGVFNPKKNDYVWIIVNSIPQFKKDNEKPFQVYSTFLDITESRKAGMELKQLKDKLELQVKEKTKELDDRIAELEHFYEVTIDRELRMEEMRNEIKNLKDNL